jgi:RNA polymerase sigma-70 factor (ECF subfamily)
MEPEEESLLVKRAQEDAVAFATLYEMHVDRIYNYIYQRTGNRLDAEDLTARTFVKAFAHLEDYVFRGVPFSAWLYRIAHNAVANWYRDRRRHKVISLDALVEQGDGRKRPEERTHAREQQQAMLKAIRKLPAERQELLILKYSEGLKNAEIARIMGRSEGAIKSLYHRTLLALRRDLARHEADSASGRTELK